MFLDDLPSATVMEGKKYYDTHIPLGYIRWTGEAGEADGEKISGFFGIPTNLKPRTFIYNHLDIEVLIHETGLTQLNGDRSYGESQITFDFEQFG